MAQVLMQLLLLLLMVVELIRNHLPQSREHHLRSRRRDRPVGHVQRARHGTRHVRGGSTRGAIGDAAVDRGRVREEMLGIGAGRRGLVARILVWRRGVRRRRLLIRLIGVRRRVIASEVGLGEGEAGVRVRSRP